MLLRKIIFCLKCNACFLFFLTSSSYPTLSQINQPPSILNIDSLSTILRNTKSDSIRVRILNTLAWEEFRSSRTTGQNKDQVILKYADEALQLSKKLKNKYQQGLAHYTTAALLRRDGKFSEALNRYFIVLKLSEEIGDKLCAGNQYMNIGDMYSVLHNIPDAITSHQKALKIFMELKDKNWIMSSCERLANIYMGIGKSEEAVKYYFANLSLAQEINDKEAIAACYINLGNVNKNNSHFPEALKYYQDALEIYEKNNTNCPDCYNNIYIGMGWVYFSEGYLNQTTDPHENYLMALNNFQKALQIATQIRSKWYMGEAYNGLAKTYEQLKNYEKALEYTKLQNQINESLFNNDAMNNIAKVKSQYELEKSKIEQEAHEQILIEREKAIRDKMLNEQRLKQQMALADEKNIYEKTVAAQKFEQQKKIAEQKAEYDKSIALEKSGKEKLKAEQERKNILVMTIVGGLSLTSIFLILLMQQRNLKKRAIEKSKTIHKMAELELQSLRSQLNPHFMFNSLNSIQELILLEENDKSHVYLSRFSKLLRMLLDNAERPFISLQKELDFLQLYIDLENLRVPNLKYSISTDEQLNTEKTFIPNMILQPYIENAIWHGLSHKEKDKELHIRIYRQNGTVNYEIEDNGVGRNKSAELKSLFRQKHQSKGMELLNKRFKLLNEEYSSNINTTITDVLNNNEVAGTLVTIKIPANLSEHILN